MSDLKAKILDILDTSKRPFFFFDDDPDGLCAFLQFARRHGDALFYPVKSKPQILQRMADKVKRTSSDAVFILDIARAEQEFFDELKVPAVWIDHHPPQDRSRVIQYNPLLENKESRPTSALAYDILNDPTDVWIAAIGAFNDQYWPDFADLLRERYPNLLPFSAKTVEDARFDSNIGLLARVFSFCMKGKESGWRKAVSCLLKINDPNEILEQSSKNGEFVWKRYLSVNKEFQELRSQALQIVPKDGLFLFIYNPGKHSVTRELADEIVSKNRDSLLIIGRLKDGEYRCSLRSRDGPPVKPVLNYALKEVNGYGGGHLQACGASVVAEDWELFLARIKEGLKLYASGDLE